MAKNLVIVESPAKAKTINKFIGKDYIVKASVGHVRDLPKSELGVDEKTFEPTYEVLEGKEKVVSELQAAAKKADAVYIASDPDREGEAIGWHVMTILGGDSRKVRRILVHAITTHAERQAITRKEKKRSAGPPFITSTLQRTVYNRYKYPVKRTMQIAQKLYEGKELGTLGFAGLITYMRTDSVRVSNDAIGEVRQYISTK